MTPVQFYRVLRDHFPFTPTERQNVFLQQVAWFVVNGGRDDLFVLKGYAGTGKTLSLIHI